MNYLITRDMDSDSDYIKHYGVLGMKWGRRYQSKKQFKIQSSYGF